MAKGTDMKSKVSLTLAMTVAASCFAFLAKAETDGVYLAFEGSGMTVAIR